MKSVQVENGVILILYIRDVPPPPPNLTRAKKKKGISKEAMWRNG